MIRNQRGGIIFRLLGLLGFVAFLALLYLVRHPLMRVAGGFLVFAIGEERRSYRGA